MRVLLNSCKHILSLSRRGELCPLGDSEIVYHSPLVRMVVDSRDEAVSLSVDWTAADQNLQTGLHLVDFS